MKSFSTCEKTKSQAPAVARGMIDLVDREYQRFLYTFRPSGHILQKPIQRFYKNWTHQKHVYY